MSTDARKKIQNSFSLITEELQEIGEKLSFLTSNNKKTDISAKISLRGRRRTPIIRKLPSMKNNLSIDSQKMNKQRLLRSLDPSDRKEKDFIEKYFNLNFPKKQKTEKLRKSSITFSRPKFKKMSPKILPRATRLDPITYPIEITENDMQKGIYSLVNLGIVSKNSDVYPSLYRENPPLSLHRALLHDWSIQFEPSMSQKNITSKESIVYICPKPAFLDSQAKLEIPVESTPNSVFLIINSGVTVKDEVYLSLLEMQDNSEAVRNLKKIEILAKDYSIPFVKINLHHLIVASQAKASIAEIVKVLENTLEVSEIITKVNNERKEKKIRYNSALHIQCCWRRYKDSAVMRRHRIRKQKVNYIQTYYLKYLKKVSTKNYASNLRENRLKKFQERQDFLLENWEKMQNEEIIEIHFASDLKEYPDPNNNEIARVIFAGIGKKTIFYVSLTSVELEIQSYYSVLMNLCGVDNENRVVYLNPSTVCKSIMKNAAKTLYLSTRALVELKKQFLGKSVVLVPFRTTEYDEFIGDFLKVPILGCTASTFEELDQFSRRKLLEGTGLAVVPGLCGKFFYEEFVEIRGKFSEKNGEKIKIIVSGQKTQDLSKWRQQKEVIIHVSPSQTVCTSGFINPHGEFSYNCSVSLLGDPHFGVLFPQTLFDECEIISICQNLTRVLYSKGIIGYISVLLSPEGIIDFQIGVGTIYPIHLFFDKIMQGKSLKNKYFVVSQEKSDLEQEMYTDSLTNIVTFENFTRKTMENYDESIDTIEERQYIWIWDLHSQSFCNLSVDAIMHMCRLQSILFSLANNEGTIFFPYGDLKNGCIGMMGIGENYEDLLKYIAAGFSIIEQIVLDKNEGNFTQIIENLKIRTKIEEIKEISKSKGYLVELL